MNLLKIDLHLHTTFSGDSLITPKELVKYAKREGLDGVAITDHNTMKGCKSVEEAAKKDDLIVIPGVEFETQIGEVIGLFIEKEIEFPMDDFFAVVRRIKQYGGIIVIPHPFDFLRDNHLKMDLLTEGVIERYIDGVEVLNARIILRRCVKKAATFCEDHSLFELGGSDAHTPKEIGQAYTEIWNYSDTSLRSIKNALLQGYSKSMGSLSSPFVHLSTIFHKLKKGAYFKEFF
ncbi:MAG: PHP domain-containing protein [Promethearchaeia archaeon]